MMKLKSKKIMSFLLVFCMFMGNFISTRAADNTNVITTNEFDYISDVMTYEEMIEQYAKEGGMSYEEALNFFPKSRAVNAKATYRELKVTLNVDSSYKPYLSFYCETSESSQYWGIVSIYSIQLIRNYNGTSKQFSGTIDAWLRTAAQIEYTINGDFYNNGTTTGGFSIGSSAKIGEKVTGNFSASISTSSNHYKYFYDHKFYNFQ